MRASAMVQVGPYAELRLDLEEAQALYEVLTNVSGAHSDRQAQVIDAMTDQVSAMLNEWERWRPEDFK